MQTSAEKIILASKSPRRARLLRQIGLVFSVITSDIDESLVTHDDPAELAMELARLKAGQVADGLDSGLVIGADTVVYKDGAALGKPSDTDEAFTMLRSLSGAVHQVYTGYTLIDIGGKSLTGCACTAVTFRDLEDWEIEDYIATGGPMDKAGAYGIQDGSGMFVSRIDGCFYNVVGFPLNRFYESLKIVWGGDKVRRALYRVKGQE